MFRLTLFVVLLFGFTVGITNAQIGLPTDTYIVRNIKSEAESLTASDASEIAVRNAQLVGLRELFARVVPAEHRNRIRVPSNDQLGLMVLSNLDQDTRSGLTTYRLVTDIEYDREAVFSYLSASGIPYVDEAPQTLLIIPQLITAQGSALVFEPENDWLDAWEQMASPNSVNWILPDQTVDSEARLASSLIEFRDVEDQMAEQGLTGGYIARLNQRLDNDGAIAGVGLQALRVGDGRGPSRIEEDFWATDLPAGATWQDLYNVAATELTNQITDEWLSSVQAVISEANTINVVVLGTDIGQWSMLARDLEAGQLVQEARFVQNRQGAIDVSIEFRGGLAELQDVFAIQGYEFEAYSLKAQPEVVGFLLQPQRFRLPAGVNILDLSLVRLNN